MDLGVSSLIGGAISGIGSLVGNMIGSKKGLQAVRETNDANKALAEYQFQQNLDMWNRQNEYNSPVNQMERLKDAGLNPNLMYGEGNVGNASNAPEYHAPNMQAYTGFGDFGASQATTQLMQGLSGYAAIRKTEAETDAIRQNTQNLEVQKQLNELKVIQQGYINSKTKDEAEVWAQLYQSRLANMDSSTVSNYSNAELRDSQRFYTDAQRERFELLTPLVKNTMEVELEQKLFNLTYISPAKWQSILADTRFKNILSELTDIKTDLLFNELEYSNIEKNYYSEHAINKLQMERYDVIIKECSKDLSKLLSEKGIKPGMSVQQAITALFAMPWFVNN